MSATAGEVTPAGVGTDGALFVGNDASGAPCSIFRVRAVDDATQKKRARRFDILAAWRIDRALALKRVDLAGGIVIQERPPRTLAALIEKAPVDEVTAIAVFHDVARAIADLHRAGLVHGNIDAQAVAIFDDGSAAIDTTGLRCTTRADALSRACRTMPRGIGIGAGDGDDDPSLDLWALGVLMLACGEGSTAACAHVDAARVERTAADLPSSPERRVSRIGILARDLLDREPSWRPTAADVARRLGILRGAGNIHGGVDDVSRAPTITADVDGEDGAAALPKSVGRFDITALLGEGAMGRVFKATDRKTGDVVAVKMLSGNPSPSARAIKRFKKEARILGEIKNPGVAALIDAGEDDGRLWMAVEYVAGETLAAVIQKGGPMPEREALAVVADLCRALIDVHDRGIVHRDIKPENILVVAHGPEQPGLRVKLIDFGVARHLEESESLAMTRQGAVMGTPLYMAPEQARGESVDARSDVYSLGTILYELLAGQAPFSGHGAALVLAMQQERAPPLVTEVRPQTSAEAARVIARALEKDPAARWQDARELLAACVRLLHEEPATIGAHPKMTAVDGVSRWVFEWDLASTPRELWPYVSNTDRLNRAIGLGAVDERVEVDDGDPMRFGHTKQAGFDLRWREHPYEWVLERRIGVLREYSEGPLRSMRSTVDLKERAPADGGGTHLVHTIEIDPRGVVGRAAAAVEVGVRTRRALDRVYRRIDELVHGKPGAEIRDAFEVHESLGSAREERLAILEKKIVDAGALPAVVARLGDFLRTASQQDVARIRPIALARSFGVDVDAMIRTCLLGAREGLLVPLWDLLCPSCRAPASIEQTLRAVREHAHCDVCNIDFDLDLGASIEMVFRVHAQIRQADAGTYCLSSPAKTPHVVAQIRALPGEHFLLETQLPEGSYQLVGRRLSYAATFRVRNEGPTSRWEMKLSSGPSADLGRVLRAGRQEMVLHNDTGREQLVRIERTQPRDDVFTAAKAAGHPLFRELFPQEVLEPGALVRVASLTFLHAEIGGAVADRSATGDPAAFAQLYGAFKAIEHAVTALGGSVVKILGDGVLAVFDDAGAAVRAALQLDDAVVAVAPGATVRAAVHRGPAAAVTLNDRLDYFGKSVAFVSALAKASHGRVIVSDDVVNDPVVQELLDDRARIRALRLGDSNEVTGPIAIA